MKFYYNGKLMRTSKNHIYTHAVINERGGLIGCRANREAAEAIISAELSTLQRGLKNGEIKKKAIESGATRYRVSTGRISYWEPVRDTDTIERCDEWIASRREKIEAVRIGWQIVELEARD